MVPIRLLMQQVCFIRGGCRYLLRFLIYSRSKYRCFLISERLIFCLFFNADLYLWGFGRSLLNILWRFQAKVKSFLYLEFDWLINYWTCA